MAEDSCCAGGSCGCRADIFPTERACPACGCNSTMLSPAISTEVL